MIRAASEGVLPNDKDGGFCIIEKRRAHFEKLKVLESGNHVPVVASEVDLAAIVEQYREIIVEIQDVTNFEGQQRQCFKPLRTMRPEDLVAGLDLNAKSHKGDGDVKMRPIHANAAHPFVPGMQLVSNVIRHRLGDCKHILRDSDDFIRKIFGFECLWK